MFIQISTSTLAARDYAGDATATLPGGVQNAAAMLTALPGTLLMNRFGRRPVMLLPAVAAVSGAALMILASYVRQMWLLVVGSIPLGVSFAQAQNFRFAAIEFAPAGFEPQAMSLVVTGAVLSAVVGPEVARHTRNAMATPYMGYVVMSSTVAAQGFATHVGAPRRVCTPDSGFSHATHAGLRHFSGIHRALLRTCVT